MPPAYDAGDPAGPTGEDMTFEPDVMAPANRPFDLYAALGLSDPRSAALDMARARVLAETRGLQARNATAGDPMGATRNIDMPPEQVTVPGAFPTPPGADEQAFLMSQLGVRPASALTRPVSTQPRK